MKLQFSKRKMDIKKAKLPLLVLFYYNYYFFFEESENIVKRYYTKELVYVNENVYK